MKILFRPAWLTILVFASLCSKSQDTLPAFTVTNRSGKVIVSWINPFDSLVQISIQRSKDSTKGFKTIVNVPDPHSMANGYLDARAPDTLQFYRLYVQQTRGRYFFTRPARPFRDTTKARKMDYASNGKPRGKYVNGVLLSDSADVKVPDARKFYTPSIYVYTNSDGNVVIALPENKSSQYSLHFFRENGTPLFRMNKIKESYLILDKVNFVQSGWYRFELYEGTVLKEKQKIFIPRERS